MSAHPTAARPSEPQWSDDPLAEAVYSWVATSEQAVAEGVLGPLLTAFADLSRPAPPLWRGLDASWPVPGPGELWRTEEAVGPWAAFTGRRDYAALWAERTLLQVRGAAGVSLTRLLAEHPGFVEPLTDAERARLYHHDLTLYERIQAEDEWLLRGAFRVDRVRADGPLRVVELVPATDRD